MRTIELASVIISSCNYARFLPAAIESALRQTYPYVEVIVVDDGSTDNSPAVIESFRDCVIPVFKPNGGQASAWNAGFEVSRGQVIVFLDSDDTLLQTAVERAVGLLTDDHVNHIQWPLFAIDEHGTRTGKLICRRPSDGDVRDAVIRGGPRNYAWPPTSGNAWSRDFIQKVLPMPEEDYRVSPDLYVHALAPLFGSVKAVRDPQSCWRVHPANRTREGSFEEKVERSILLWDRTCAILRDRCHELGIQVDPELWKDKSWFYPLQSAVRDIEDALPAGVTFLLVDQDTWGTDDSMAGRRRVVFPERNGRYAGAPANGQAAIDELERQRCAGASFIVFGWPAFWWLDVYTDFAAYVRSSTRMIVKNPRVMIFDLRRCRDAAGLAHHQLPC